MRRITAIILAVLAIAASTAAIATYAARRPTTELAQGERIFPGLAERLPRAARIEVAKGAERFTLAKAGEGWQLAEKGGYPASHETVRQALLGLSDLTVVEAKTAKGDLLPRLDLSDEKATAVTVKDEGGQTVAALLIGKSRYGSGAALTEAPMVYVRRAGETQAWLAQGALDVKPAAVDWLDKAVIDLKADRVAGVEVKPADANDFALVAAEDGKSFRLEPMPEGMKVKSQYDMDSLGGALEGLAFDDVTKAEGLGAPLSTVTWRLKDGGTVTGVLAEKAGDRWLTLTGEAAAKAAGWAFKLPDWKRRLFQLKRDDLVEPEKKDPPPGG